MCIFRVGLRSLRPLAQTRSHQGVRTPPTDFEHTHIKPHRLRYADLDPIQHPARTPKDGWSEGAPSRQSSSVLVVTATSALFIARFGAGHLTYLYRSGCFNASTNRGAATSSSTNHPIAAATQDSLREQLGVVFQGNFLFNTSVRENIRPTRYQATDVGVENAARQAETHDFMLTLPQRYDTLAVLQN